MSASVIFEAISSDEDENTSAEERGDVVSDKVSHIDDDEFDRMLEEVEEEEKEVSKPLKGPKPSKGPKPPKGPVNGLAQIFGQLVEPATFYCVFEQDGTARTLGSGNVPEGEMRPEEVAFVQKSTTLDATFENGMEKVRAYFDPILQELTDKVAGNAPMHHIMTSILGATYTEMYSSSAPKKKDVKIINCFTGKTWDSAGKSAYKGATFIYFLRTGEDPSSVDSYDGYYMSRNGSNLITLVHMLKYWDFYMRDRIRACLTQYKDTVLKDASVLSDWDALYEQLTQGFSKQAVAKWKQTKDVVAKGSFVHTIIMLRRTFDAVF